MKKDILLCKPRARNKILFQFDKIDDWFIDVIHFDPKSGEESRRHFISGRSIDDWLSSYYSEGWVIDDGKEKVKPKKEIKKKNKKKSGN